MIFSRPDTLQADPVRRIAVEFRAGRLRFPYWWGFIHQQKENCPFLRGSIRKQKVAAGNRPALNQTMNTQKKVKLTLEGLDGNAFSLIGAFRRAARRQGWTAEEISELSRRAMAGNYDHLLNVLMDVCEEEE